MRIRKKVYRIIDTDVGLQAVREFPTGPRKGKTTCSYCGSGITDETFLVAFCDKVHNLFFHRTCYSKACFDIVIYKNGDPKCSECGHAYHRHYDISNDEKKEPDSGCKYCQCTHWKPKDDWDYPILDGDN